MLRAALATVHRDPAWWRTVLLGGALTLTLVGYPLVVGLVMESLDNSRRGFPTPLPRWSDWGTRYLVGLLALVIDFAFFIMPILLVSLVTFCIGALAATSSTTHPQILTGIFVLAGILVSGMLLLLFLSSVSPVARLIYAREGRIEDALGWLPLRQTLRGPQRGAFWRARMASLAAYVPMVGILALLLALSPLRFPGQAVGMPLLAWLAASALFYAHLVVVQLYVAAERHSNQI